MVVETCLTSIHMTDEYFPKYENISKVMKKYLWLRKKSAWFMFLAIYIGFGAWNVSFFFSYNFVIP